MFGNGNAVFYSVFGRLTKIGPNVGDAGYAGRARRMIDIADAWEIAMSTSRARVRPGGAALLTPWVFACVNVCMHGWMSLSVHMCARMRSCWGKQ